MIPFWGHSCGCIPLEGPLGWKASGGLTHVSGSWCWHSAEALGSPPRDLSVSSRLVWAVAGMVSVFPEGKGGSCKVPGVNTSKVTFYFCHILLAKPRPRASTHSRGWRNAHHLLMGGAVRGRGVDTGRWESLGQLS